MLCAGKGQMWSPSDDDHVPEYYRQWAATIARLGHDEQMRTLAQMSEDDRLIVQRLMDRSSVRHPGSTDLDRPEVPSPKAGAQTRSSVQCSSVSRLRVVSMLGRIILIVTTSICDREGALQCHAPAVPSRSMLSALSACAGKGSTRP